MRKILLTLISIFLLGIISCGNNQRTKSTYEGTIDQNSYYSNDIDWKVEIPIGWTITTKDAMVEHSELGQKILQETVEDDIDISKVKNLISFEKNHFNNFQSTSEPFKSEFKGDWEEHTNYIKRVIFSSYKNQGLEVDSTATEIERINNVDFQTYSFKIYNTNGDILLNQIIYSSLVNGFDFSVNINFNNNSDRDELLKVLKSSKFIK